MAASGCTLLPGTGTQGSRDAMSRSGSATAAEAATDRVTAADPVSIASARPLAAAVTPGELAAPLAGTELPRITLPRTDLVARIRAGFSLPAVDDPDVAQELAFYASHPDYIARVFERGSRYLHHISAVLEERGMPSDLALLPIVESAFDPFAYSRGRASGLWQIIPGTGRRLGLKQNWWYDGRRDIVDSTRAALDYLELLHDQFDGDWLLAVAGYNSGEGNVARAIRRAEADGRPTDFWSIRGDLPAETRAYVPRLLAIRDLVAAAEDHEIELPLIDDAPYFDIVETEGQIDVALAAELAALDVDTVYALNPGINRWATDPDGPHRLLVPAEAAPVRTDALASLDMTERVRWTCHQIGRGETLSQIAVKYETTPDVLRQINGISGNLIRAGDHLMIPHASAASGTYSLSLDARVARTQERERDGQRVDYRVEPGDSLWSISRRFGVGTAELASWNAMAPGDVLSVGRTLVIWTDDPVAAAAAAPAGPAQIRQVNYVVRSGDSLARIAGRFRVSVAELVEWNALSVDKYLQPGQSLVLYVDVTEQST
ncbi:MAG: LysM peptidoglycan-binding domain-containing protein [Gammaproteobacteria bacterium]|nr:LysM peptidoglycan-binding domain-containing protein [Gammaproteobacteria bacterium]